MAASADTAATAANVQPSSTTPNDKKSRKNPARRKADRANSNANINQPKDTTALSKSSLLSLRP